VVGIREVDALLDDVQVFLRDGEESIAEVPQRLVDGLGTQVRSGGC
jgi:hypothetical protein